jgi:hypothetical protein
MPLDGCQSPDGYKNARDVWQLGQGDVVFRFLALLIEQLRLFANALYDFLRFGLSLLVRGTVSSDNFPVRLGATKVALWRCLSPFSLRIWLSNWRHEGLTTRTVSGIASVPYSASVS